MDTNTQIVRPATATPTAKATATSTTTTLTQSTNHSMEKILGKKTPKNTNQNIGTQINSQLFLLTLAGTCRENDPVMDINLTDELAFVQLLCPHFLH